MKLEFEGSWDGITRQIETMLGIRQGGQEVTTAPDDRLIRKRLDVLMEMMSCQVGRGAHIQALLTALDNILMAPESDDADAFVRESCARAVQRMVSAGD